jgi:uncharacterized SAM-binding protein YcdF (DUF218 family)
MPPNLRRALRVLAVPLLGWLLSLVAIAAWSRRASPDQADAIIVLGAAQYGGRPSPVLRARLDHALGLWKTGRAPRVVLTGGRRPGDLLSEAAAGRRYLVRRGIPNEAMLLETEGRTTLASLRAAARLLRERQDGARRVLLVSDPFHMLRLELLARLEGLEPLPSPTRTSPITANGTVLEYMLRESVAIPADLVLQGWLTVTGD